MSNEIGSRVRYGEAFWRAHHEAWQQSALNQREYCETHGMTCCLDILMILEAAVRIEKVKRISSAAR